VDQISFVLQETVLAVGEVPGHLAHPRAVRIGLHAGDLDTTRGDIDHEQDQAANQAARGEQFHREKVRRGQHIQMTADELIPRGLAVPLGFRADAVVVENPFDRGAADGVT